MKKKLLEDLRKSKQGKCTVSEYEWEFLHIMNYILYFVRDDKDKAVCFERGLRPDIFKEVHSFKLQTIAEVLDSALWAEQGNTIA